LGPGPAPAVNFRPRAISSSIDPVLIKVEKKFSRKFAMELATLTFPPESLAGGSIG